MSEEVSPALAALVQSLGALDGATDAESAISATLTAVRAAFGWAYGSFWRLDPQQMVLVFDQEVGDAGPAFREVTRRSSFAPGVGLAGRTWASRQLQFAPDLGQVTDCVRAPVATAAGVKSGVCLPIIVRDKVIGTLDFFSLSVITLSPAQRMALETVARQLSHTVEQIGTTEEAESARRDAEALSEVVSTLTQHEDRESLLKAVLTVVREAFGWEYGSVWRRDRSTEALRFWVESGTVDAAFAKATAEAAFPRGVGLSGRTWESGDLVFVEDLAQVHDCSRAPAARDAGVQSGVCLPIRIQGEIDATMDFFTTSRLPGLSDTRQSALRQVAQLTSARLTRLLEREKQREEGLWEHTSALVQAELASASSATELQARLAQALGAVPGLIGATLTDARGKSLLTTPPATARGAALGWTDRSWAGETAEGLRLVLTLSEQPLSPARTGRAAAGMLGVIAAAQQRIQEQQERVVLAQRLFEGVSTLEATLTDLAGDSTQQASAVAEVTASLSELRQTSSQARDRAEALLEVAEGAGQTAQAGKAVVAQTRTGMETIRDRVETIRTAIANLAEHTVQIDEIISTVNEIAEQSKLLALNASIEAARAGEYGRSFSVVANEMRDLAEQSKQATRQVRQLLSDIENATSSAVVATEDGIAKVEEGLELTRSADSAMDSLSEAVGKTTEACHTITRVSQEQGEGVTQVAEAMTSIDSAVRRTATNIEEVRSVTADLSDAAQGLDASGGSAVAASA